MSPEPTVVYATVRDGGDEWHIELTVTKDSTKVGQLVLHDERCTSGRFRVDRKDLDYQTTKEFNSFSAGSIDGTDDTRALVHQRTLGAAMAGHPRRRQHAGIPAAQHHYPRLRPC